MRRHEHQYTSNPRSITDAPPRGSPGGGSNTPGPESSAGYPEIRYSSKTRLSVNAAVEEGTYVRKPPTALRIQLSLRSLLDTASTSPKVETHVQYTSICIHNDCVLNTRTTCGESCSHGRPRSHIYFASCTVDVETRMESFDKGSRGIAEPTFPCVV